MSASTDISKFIKGLGEHRERVVQAGLKALDQAGAHVLGNAQELCPIDKGNLAASATSLPAEIQGDSLSKEIGFTVNYAAAVHENLDANFNKDKNPRAQAKFLETALREGTPAARDYVMEAMKKIS